MKQQGVTLIITTHYMDEAEQLCDRLAVMDQGRFAAEGRPADLIAAYSTREVVELRFASGEPRGRRPPASTAWSNGSRCSPTGSSSTPTTATRP